MIIEVSHEKVKDLDERLDKLAMLILSKEMKKDKEKKEYERRPSNTDHHI